MKSKELHVSTMVGVEQQSNMLVAQWYNGTVNIVLYNNGECASNHIVDKEEVRKLRNFLSVCLRRMY